MNVGKQTEGADIGDGIPLPCCWDSDCAGDFESKRSSSGEMIVLGGALVESSSHTQPGTPAASPAR